MTNKCKLHIYHKLWQSLGAIPLVMIVAGCGDNGGSSNDASQDEIDPLVIEAVAPFNAETQLSSDLVNYQIEQQFYAVVEDCIESLGVPRIGLEFEQRPAHQLIGRTVPDFPDINALAADGFWPLTEDDFFSDEDRNILSDDQRSAMAQCYDHESVEHERNISDDFHVLRGAWFDVLLEIDNLEEVQDKRNEFTSCIVDAGIDSSAADSEATFVASLEALTEARGPETLDEANVVRKELGQLFAECGRDLFELKEDLRSGSRRNEFLADHHNDMRELSENLYGEGTLDEVSEAD